MDLKLCSPPSVPPSGRAFERADLPAGTVPFPLGPQGGGLREGGGLAEPDPPTPGGRGEGRYPDRAQRSIRAKAPLKSAPFLRGAVLMPGRARRRLAAKLIAPAALLVLAAPPRT